jgi:uncharacterized protein YoxC
MSDITLIDKINLRNKYLNKIIKNFKEVNRSLELLNNVNKKMNRQYGGGALQDIFKQAEQISKDITQTVQFTQPQIEALDESSENIVKELSNIIDSLKKLPINSGTQIITNEAEIRQQIDDMKNKI